VWTKTLVHLWTCERESTAHGGSQDCVSSESRRGVDAVRVDEVVGRVDEDTAISSAEGDAGDEREDPVNVGGACPALVLA
jgi:hypothetical protein